MFIWAGSADYYWRLKTEFHDSRTWDKFIHDTRRLIFSQSIVWPDINDDDKIKQMLLGINPLISGVRDYSGRFI